MTARETPAGEEWRGKVGKLSEEELDTFLAGGNVARLGCLDPSGWPYVVPTWYQWADGGFYIIPRARSAWAQYMADDGRVSAVVMMEFALAAYTGAALALIPPGGAEAAVEDKVLPASLMENTAEMLNVLAAPLGDASGRHQRLETTYGPHDDVPSGVKPQAAMLGLRVDMVIEVGGYGSGRLAVVVAV